MSIEYLIGKIVMGDLENVTSALKLQELVKEKIKEYKRNAGGMVYGMTLESLLDESKK